MVASPFVESYVIMVGVVFADTCKEKQSATVTKYGENMAKHTGNPQDQTSGRSGC